LLYKEALGGVISGNLSGRVLSAQLRTALSTTCVQDFAAGFCGHTRTETVTPFAHKVGRLKGAFHRAVSRLVAADSN
jgi:hypothetical protein